MRHEAPMQVGPRVGAERAVRGRQAQRGRELGAPAGPLVAGKCEGGGAGDVPCVRRLRGVCEGARGGVASL